MNTELFIAAEAGDDATIERLQKKNKDVLNSVSIRVDSALDDAVMRGHLNPSLADASEAADVLLDRTFNGDTPLHIAARKGRLDLVKYILKLKPSLGEARNKDGNMPLHEAAKTGSRDVVEEFLKAKESLTGTRDVVEKFLKDKESFNAIPNIFPETPLIIASQYGHVEIVKLLLDAPSSQYLAAAPEVKRSLREAAYRGYKDVFVALLDKTPTDIPDRILHEAVQGEHLDILEVMLDHSSWRSDSMMEKDKHGRCAIHVAAMKGRWEIIDEFMSKMPDSDEIRSSDEKSVLHFAIEYDQFSIVSGLLEKIEADKAVKMVSRDHDRARNTAFHFAAINGASIQILDLLLPFRGDNINALNDEGKSALDIASTEAKDIVKRLEDVGAKRVSLVRNSNTTSNRSADIINTHMVVASLIATITFAAMFQIPGGIEDDQNSIHYGAAKLSFDKVARMFIFSDTVAFTASITVVVGWLIQQQLQDSNPGSSVLANLSDFSEASLLVSIFWTVLAFLTATITVVIPQNLQNMKSKDKEAFNKYELMLRYEISLAVCTPLLVLAVYIGAKDMFLRYRRSSSNSFLSTKIVRLVFVLIAYLAILVLCFSFK